MYLTLIIAIQEVTLGPIGLKETGSRQSHQDYWWTANIIERLKKQYNNTWLITNDSDDSKQYARI